MVIIRYHSHLHQIRLGVLAVCVGFVAARTASDVRTGVKPSTLFGMNISRNIRSLIINFLALLFIIIVGVVYYTVRANFTMIDAIYQTIQTITSGQ